MDNFDSKDFYGHSLSGDPKLRTTTRNYEFKYNSSDQLERVISRVKMDRDKKPRADDSSNRAMIFPDIGKLRTPFSTHAPSAMLKASSIETQIGRSTSRMTVIKVMSDAEIDAMLSQSAVSSNTSLPISTEVSSISLREIPSVGTESSVESFFQGYQASPQCRRIEIKIPRHPVQVLLSKQPQWVEIEPTQKSVASVMDLPSTSDTDVTTDNSVVHIGCKDSTDENDQAETEQAETDQAETERDLDATDVTEVELPKKNQSQKSQRKSVEQKSSRIIVAPDEISLGSKTSDDFVLRNDDSDTQQNGAESPPESPLSIGIESPLNHYERAEMQRVLGKVLPHVPVMEFNQLDSPDDSISSDYVDDPDDFEEGEPVQDEPMCTVKEIQTVEEPAVPNVTSRAKHPAKTRRSKAADTHRCSDAAKSDRTSRSLSICSNKVKPMLDPKTRTQIEILKYDKIRIFSKMTQFQEKIIELLDRLRMSILEISLPDGHMELRIRERNAFEFAVRFSRNYLFPLGKMIEELRVSPKDDYCSAVTNEPCSRVCGIYGLLNQALLTYHKQLRHFFTDGLPKKLDIVLNMIIDTTNICLHKKIFDNRDTLIQCLLLRCNIFLEFVLKFAQQRKRERGDEIPRSVRSGGPYKMAKTSSKWDLTMNLNNLNMYEPKLVPKKPKKTPHKRTIQALIAKATARTKESNKPVSDTPQSAQQTLRTARQAGETVALPAADPVDTQISFTAKSESLQLISTAIEEQPDSELTKSVIEALQDITKDEVRQMLGPIFLNLDNILKTADAPQSLKSVLDAVNSQLLARCKIQNEGAAAAENNTQMSGGTSEKDLTKKGTDCGNKGGRKKDTRLKQRSNSTTEQKSRSYNAKADSTEQTESQTIRRGNTIRDKQSVINSDVAETAVTAAGGAAAHCGATATAAGAAAAAAVAVSENDSMIRKNRSRGFIGISTSMTTGKKATPLQPQSQLQPLSQARVQSELVLSSPPPEPPAPPQSPMTPIRRLTSQGSEYVATRPATVSSSADQLAAKERQRPGDRGRYPSVNIGYRRRRTVESDDSEEAAAAAVAASTVSIGNANANERSEMGNSQQQGARQRNQQPSVTKVGATAMDQIEQLNYCSNAMYTFVRHSEQTTPFSTPELDIYDCEPENVPNEECFTDSCTRLMFSAKLPQNESFNSPCGSNQNLLTSIADDVNRENVRVLNEERLQFIEKCKEDPLYTNPQFPQPWRVLSKISQSIANEIVGNFENDISFGENSYVQDFINMETRS